jgi:hypothetical protein
MIIESVMVCVLVRTTEITQEKQELRGASGVFEGSRSSDEKRLARANDSGDPSGLGTPRPRNVTNG